MQDLITQYLAEIEQFSTGNPEELEQFRIKFLSKKGLIPSLFEDFKNVAPEQRREMETAIKGHVPAVISSNFSVGVNIFWQLIRDAGRLLKDYDIEVLEAHHRNKKDAPSGTAKTILQILDEEAGTRQKMYGREGMTERKNEIGVHVIRGGDIVGDHKVMFSKNFETIELSHRAYDRSVFATGALHATRWVVGKKPGIYGMNDVLELGKK